MHLRKWAIRSIRLTGALVLSIALLTFLAVQLLQWTLRQRAERLSKEMHEIRLSQTTWADAQQLMHRWGCMGLLRRHLHPRELHLQH